MKIDLPSYYVGICVTESNTHGIIRESGLSQNNEFVSQKHNLQLQTQGFKRGIKLTAVCGSSGGPREYL